MITIEDQQKLLISVSRKLKRKLKAYAIGGTAMMFLGIKESTVDIDIVFENKEDREIFKEAAKSLGYSEMNPFKIYGMKKYAPDMLSLGDVRFDLFVWGVVDFIFSENMQKRAETIHQFGDNLTLKIANPADLIMMKCATDRLKDIDDARKIIKSKNIDWDILREEAKNQINLGKKTAALDLGFFLEKLKNKIKVNIPTKVLDGLFEVVKQQIEQRKQ